MLKQYEGYIDILDLLKQVYNYDFKGDPEEFAMQPFIELEGTGVNALYWITIDGERYLFKRIQEAKANVWGELLSAKIAQELGLPAAEYRAAKLGNTEGVLTKNFLKENEKLISGSEFFQEFFNNYPYGEKQGNLIFDETFRELYEIPEEYTKLEPFVRRKKTFYRLNNVHDIWTLLESTYPNREQTTEIVEYLLKLLIFDCITIQGDRHPNNWSIITDGSSIYPAPLFDNQIAFGLGYQDMDNKMGTYRNMASAIKFTGTSAVDEFIYQQKPCLQLENSYYPDIETRTIVGHTELFREIIANSDDSLMSYIKESLNKLTEDKIDELITNLEKENGIRMDSLTYFYITNIINYNISKLSDIVKTYEEENNHGKTK